MNSSIPIIVKETSGITRKNEPVTVGIPFPKGLVKNPEQLCLLSEYQKSIPVQAKTLANWHDGSLKWGLFDFQISVEKKNARQLNLSPMKQCLPNTESGITIAEGQNKSIIINTNAAVFTVNTQSFTPFQSVYIKNIELLDITKTRTILTDTKDSKYEPVIENIFFETEGPLRSTLKIEGVFKSKMSTIASFYSRVHFFLNHSDCKIEFTIRNPNAAVHPGGLWDLGDAGSIYFKDLSIQTALLSDKQITSSCWFSDEGNDSGNELKHHSSLLLKTHRYQLPGKEGNILLYQDSSGGENWQSLNHQNKNGEVKTSFRGFRLLTNGYLTHEGLRASPVMSTSTATESISGAIRHFWQNFPKAIEAHNSVLSLRLFPNYYNDYFELQGGEQKTHTFFLNFLKDKSPCYDDLSWCISPLQPSSTPEWYEKTQAIPYITKQVKAENNSLAKLVDVAVSGKNTFFKRREIIDEYGWRNFGDFYADHEAVGYTGKRPLISHYNNQYDCLFGSIIQFLRTGNSLWQRLASELCHHIRDIDIYHTDMDRPEYNHGLFWHTEHYIDARTATHRCFSKKHSDQRNLAAYGGGPSLSHVYSTGLLYHYYLTGDNASKEAVEDLAFFIESNVKIANTLCNFLIKKTKHTVSLFKKLRSNRKLVEENKVYGLDGPGRASGNSLSTLMDAYHVTAKNHFIEEAEKLICQCISYDDDINNRDLLDFENRWMYTVFLQALGKYLDIKTEKEQFDEMWHYSRTSLMLYATWMIENEILYLSHPNKLEFPNETWAAQELRKCNVLLYAAKYSDDCRKSVKFIEKARFFYENCSTQLFEFESKSLTRPIILILQNRSMFENYISISNSGKKFAVNQKGMSLSVNKRKNKLKLIEFKQLLYRFPIQYEIHFLKWLINNMKKN